MENRQTNGFFDRVETFMFSRKFIFIGVLSITIPLTVNLYQLYYNISPVAGNYFKHIYAFAYSFAFAIAVLVFTFHKIGRKPIIFAIFILIVEILFFDPFDPTENYLIRLTKVFLCVFGAYTGYSYAELYAKKASENRSRMVDHTGNTIVNTSKPVVNEVLYTCEHCHKSFPSVKALNGHMAAHKNSKTIIVNDHEAVQN
ncbi:C2H2-type zinc finger protein [Fulvivirga sp. 29W222]|uniref:C2H2-type zinc finger protein n=1 Tax=Fulvivirga marina TaxID=2494733 RepID=A0A937FTN4_9BACT|nr:C2H2-type zinc finger protein [Fulvivirga marina]MBL6445735.1 C2H2-type zinc finger protein [Fulvivirga marina]